MTDYSKWTLDELEAERSRIEAEMKRRHRHPFGAGWLVDPKLYGCCGLMPCVRTACPVSVTAKDAK